MIRDHTSTQQFQPVAYINLPQERDGRYPRIVDHNQSKSSNDEKEVHRQNTPTLIFHMLFPTTLRGEESK